MAMTDAYELARKSNAHLYPAVEEFVGKVGKTDDVPSSTAPSSTPEPSSYIP